MRYLFLLLQFLFVYFTPAMPEVAAPFSGENYGVYSSYRSSFNENQYSLPSLNNAQSMKYQSFPPNTSFQTKSQNPSFNQKHYAYNNMNNGGLLYEDLHYSLEELKRSFNIIGYNLYNLLKKNLSVNNHNKLKIDEYYGINVGLLDTLGRIINNEPYPSLYLKSIGVTDAHDQPNLVDGNSYFDENTPFTSDDEDSYDENESWAVPNGETEEEDFYFQGNVPIIPVTPETSNDEDSSNDDESEAISNGETVEDDDEEVDVEEEGDVDNNEEEEVDVEEGEDVDDDEEEEVDVEEGGDVDNDEEEEVDVEEGGDVDDDEEVAVEERVDVDDDEEVAVEERVDVDDDEEVAVEERVDVDDDEEMNTLENDDDIFSGNGSSIVSSADDSDGELIGGIIGGLVGGAALGVLGGSLLGEEAVSGAQTAINSGGHGSYSENDTVDGNDAASYEEDASNWSNDETLIQNDNIVPEKSVENADQVQSTNDNIETQNQNSIAQASRLVGEETITNQNEYIAETQNQNDSLIENIDKEESIITQEDIVKTKVDKIEQTSSGLMAGNSQQQPNASSDLQQAMSAESGAAKTAMQELPLQSANLEITIQEFINSGNKEIIFKELREPQYLNQSDPILHKNRTFFLERQTKQDELMKQAIIHEDGKIHAKDF